MSHKSGFVSIIGKPNVGKSSFLNTVLGSHMFAVTHKPQTTRHRILGILNDVDYQLIFSDLPGIIKPAYELQKSMMEFVKEAFTDSDVLVIMVDVKDHVLFEETILEKFRMFKSPILVLINKIDTSDQLELESSVALWNKFDLNTEILPISVKENFNIDQAVNRIINLLPEGAPYFDKDQITDRSKRFFVNEKIREKILLHCKKEVPYAVEVLTEEFKDTEELLKIRSIIMVERNTQKAIIIGYKGKLLRKIGTEAREDLEKFFGKKIFLNTIVKVNKDWRKKESQLKRFGYKSN